MFGNDVGTVALEALPRTVHLQEIWIVVAALTGQDFPVAEAHWIARQVPFANHSRVITGVLHQPWKGGLRAVKTVSISEKPIHVTMLARQDTCS